jgi:acetoin utilization deacetylase AcuC-like enzyme
MQLQKQLYIAHAPVYAHAVPDGHRFPMGKYELIPAQLLHEGVITQQNIHAPTTCPTNVVLAAHCANYVAKLQNLQLTAKEQRAIGFTQSQALIQREFIIMQGTINCALAAIQNGIALNVAGGTHHAFTNRGEGFCLLNDMAIAAHYLLNHQLAQKILIIDLDVHQGNGTAQIFATDNRVFTFSMHGATNYPFIKEKSSLDVGLENGTDTATYLQLLQYHLPIIIAQHQPQHVFYQSGVDILATDKFGKLNVTMEGCLARDIFVFETLQKYNIPCTVAMGGGYSPQIKTIVEAHCNTFKAAKSIYNL